MASNEGDSWLGRLLAAIGIIVLTGPAIWIGLTARGPRAPAEPPPQHDALHPPRPVARRLRIVEGPLLAADAQGRPAIQWRTNLPAESFVSFGVADPTETVLGKYATLVMDHSVPLPDEPFSGLRRFHVISVAEEGETVSAELGPGGGRTEVFRLAPERFGVLGKVGLAAAFAWADFDSDGRLDVAICLSTDSGALLKVTYVPRGAPPPAPRRLPLAGEPRGAHVADFNADGRADLLVAGEALELFAGRRAPQGGLEWAAALALGDSTLVGSAAADADGDGLPDVLALLDDGSLRLYRNSEPSALRFEPVSVRGAMGGGAPVALLACADFTGDDAADILMGGDAMLMLVRADGGWQPARHVFPDDMPPPGPGATAVPADWDGDGDLDLLFLPGDASPGVVLFRNDGTGRLAPVGAGQGELAELAGTVRCAAWADLDGNGWLDLVLGAEPGGLRVYLGADGRFMDATVLCRLPVPADVVPTFVRAVDLDGDGAPDLVVGLAGGRALLLQNRWHPGPADHRSQPNLSE